MSAPHELCITRTLGEERAHMVQRSLVLEIQELVDERSRTTIEVDGGSIVVEIAAEDLIALRAAANTWFGLLDVAERSADAAASRY